MKKTNRLFSLRRKIMLSVLSIVSLIIISLYVSIFIGAIGELNYEYKELQLRVESNIRNVLTLTDRSYRMIEKYYEDIMTESFKPFLGEYELSGKNPDKMDLNKVKEMVGGQIDLYIISDGIITHGTYSGVIGLDFRGYAHFYERLVNIQKGKKVVVERITPDVETGFLRVWSYIPTPDNKYLFE
jgi:hypothetical protein